MECSRSTYREDRPGPSSGTMVDDAPEGLHCVSLLPQSCLFSRGDTKPAQDGNTRENNTEAKMMVCILGLGERIEDGHVRRSRVEHEEIEESAERVTTVGDGRGASTCTRKERDSRD